MRLNKIRVRARDSWRALCVCAIALFITASGAGCAVGFQRASTAPREAPSGAPLSLDWDRVTIVAPYRDSLVTGLERLLSERGVREISFAKARPPSRDETIVEVSDRPDASFLSDASVLVSLFTFSVIPGYGASDHHVALTLHRPDADPRKFEYRFRETVVIWLPLALFRPDVVAGVNGGWEREDPLNAVRLEIARRFVDDAAKPAPAASPAVPSGS